jgi:hypothetical protein
MEGRVGLAEQLLRFAAWRHGVIITRMSQSFPSSPEFATSDLDRADGFPGDADLKSPSPTLVYKAGVFGVAVAMVVLPLVYGVLVLGIAVGVSIFAIQALPTNSGFLSWFVYALVIFTGGAVVAFLLKPVFVRNESSLVYLEIGEGDHPELERLLGQLCALIKAPSPKKIAVDCSVNACVTFLDGLRSLFSGELVLVIGLPMVRAMSRKSFAGVLAHELGHFAQGGGMRLTYVIRRMNGWFYRAVYHRDHWDARLDRAAKYGRLGLFCQVAQLGIWAARRVLFVLMLCGQAISCFVLRRMEFNADYFETHVAGSHGFKENTEKIALLHQAAVDASVMVNDGLHDPEIGLPDDLPLLISRLATRLPRNRLRKISSAMASSGGSLLDTHPSDLQRIGKAVAQRKMGLEIDGGDGPASLLFNDFDAFSKEVTTCHFEEFLGEPPPDRLSFVDTETLVAGEFQRRERVEGSLAYFGARLEPWDGLLCGEGVAAGDEDLSAARKGVARLALKLAAAEQEHSTSVRGAELVRAGFSLSRSDKGRIAIGLAGRRKVEAFRDQLIEAQQSIALRMRATLHDDCDALMTFVVACDESRPTMIKIRDLLLRQEILIQHLEPGSPSHPDLQLRLNANALELKMALCELLERFASIPNPLCLNETVTDRLQAEGLRPYAGNPVFRGFQAATTAMSRLSDLYSQALGAAALIAAKAENR